MRYSISASRRFASRVRFARGRLPKPKLLDPDKIPQEPNAPEPPTEAKPKEPPVTTIPPTHVGEPDSKGPEHEKKKPPKEPEPPPKEAEPAPEDVPTEWPEEDEIEIDAGPAPVWNFKFHRYAESRDDCFMLGPVDSMPIGPGGDRSIYVEGFSEPVAFLMSTRGGLFVKTLEHDGAVRFNGQPIPDNSKALLRPSDELKVGEKKITASPVVRDNKLI
ncbi:TPA: hypothetical protein EYP38_05485, partial [Candidatus Micrarchaeota archaeon]|nr:hypothetical protein [Candidatus Micrarchaeota archaeon]